MTKPGEVYRVDLGMGGKVRMMMVVSRHHEMGTDKVLCHWDGIFHELKGWRRRLDIIQRDH